MQDYLNFSENIVEGEHFLVLSYEFEEITEPIKMIWVSPGRFSVGSSEEELVGTQGNEHFRSNIQQGYWIAQFPVTVAQWTTIFNDTKQNEDKNPNSSQLPQTNITWYDALSYCWELNRRHLAARTFPKNYRFTLPTEMQWEYACKAQDENTSLDAEALNKHAWFSENSGRSLQAVGSKVPNKWKLYDMLGNTHEWCLDSPSDYPTGEITDWIGKGDGFTRVVRGGGYNATNKDCQCYSRDWMEPNTRLSSVGFRIVLSPFHNYLNL